MGWIGMSWFLVLSPWTQIFEDRTPNLIWERFGQWFGFHCSTILEGNRYSGKMKEDRKRTEFQSERHTLINILNAFGRRLKLVKVRGLDRVINPLNMNQTHKISDKWPIFLRDQWCEERKRTGIEYCVLSAELASRRETRHSNVPKFSNTVWHGRSFRCGIVRQISCEFLMTVWSCVQLVSSPTTIVKTLSTTFKHSYSIFNYHLSNFTTLSFTIPRSRSKLNHKKKTGCLLSTRFGMGIENWNADFIYICAPTLAFFKISIWQGPNYQFY